MPPRRRSTAHLLQIHLVLPLLQKSPQTCPRILHDEDVSGDDASSNVGQLRLYTDSHADQLHKHTTPSDSGPQPKAANKVDLCVHDNGRRHFDKLLPNS